ncbi:MAG: YdeI/OmpD-associated family protein [Candidatus Protochlamydia sp.]|nr:YdeI/OmpD-associated family protein [Candidatus Protochlamydia sp.]
MVTKNTPIDAYIEKSKPFAKPILNYFRKLVHEACPDAEETLKWSAPHFSYKGLFCGMAAFQEHCAFGFWKGSIMQDRYNVLDKGRENAMGQFGRITSIDDLPEEKIILEYLREAMQLNDLGVKVPKKLKNAPCILETLPYLVEALSRNKRAQEHFDRFTPGKKKEYVCWLVDAKQEATREKRLKTAIEWISEGKGRNWKYENC